MIWERIRQRYPLAQKVPTRDVELIQIRNFLAKTACEMLAALIEAQRRPSTIAGDQTDLGFRTSETCDLFPTHPEVTALDQRLSDLLGIAPEYGEIMQGQRYAPGQEFKPHTDYFTPDTSEYARFCGVMGQRTWTAMIYLNAPIAGGATRFKVIDKLFQPEAGKLLCWNNLLPDGSINPATLHHGMKVRAGTKYIITKWFRERPTGYGVKS